MIAALVLFSLDSLVMLGMMALSWDVSWLVDVAFHAWVMYYLVIGVAANSRLKGMPSMEELQAAEAAGQAQPEPAPELPAQ